MVNVYKFGLVQHDGVNVTIMCMPALVYFFVKEFTKVHSKR